jgi:LacI family transcriptional regulator
VAIIGFDDFEMEDIFNPPVTVVRQPSLELGRVAAELLFARFEQKDVSLSLSGQQIILPLELIIRESCGCTARKVLKSFNSKRA